MCVCMYVSNLIYIFYHLPILLAVFLCKTVTHTSKFFDFSEPHLLHFLNKV
jgi:hypothetical protein